MNEALLQLLDVFDDGEVDTAVLKLHLWPGLARQEIIEKSHCSTSKQLREKVLQQLLRDWMIRECWIEGETHVFSRALETR